MKKDELTNCLEQIFDFMSKKGVQFSADNKKSIIHELSEALENKVSPQEMNNGNFQKKLMYTINAKLLGNDKEFQNMKGVLAGNDKTSKLSPEMQAKADMSSLLVMTMSKLLPGKNDKGDEAADKTSKLVLAMTDIIKKLKKKDKKEENTKDPDNLEEKQLEATLRNLNGGDNPCVDGEIQIPIIGPIFGDLMAVTNQCQADPNSVSLMKEAITFNPGKEDPLGQEIKSKAATISQGADIDINPSFQSPLKTKPDPIE